MDCSVIPRILEELKLDEKDVANIYHHGSWVYGSNTPTSDRDLIIVTRSSNQKPLKFIDSIDYFHEFELHKLWNKYDVCVYSVENFEKLLEKNYLCSVQCIFLPDEFKIKEEIDFQTTYLNQYYNILRLKQVACYEMSTDLGLYESNNFSKHSTCSSRSIQTSQSRKDYVFKKLFHGLRYLDFVEQLIRTRSIHDFKRATYLFDEMKEIRGDSTDDSSMERVVQFVRKKSAEFKPKYDALIPENIIKGTFKAHITFYLTHDIDHVIEKLKTTCQNTKYKLRLTELVDHKEIDHPPQLIVSSHYHGEYPSIVKDIEEEVYKYFHDFHIICITIQSLLSNEGVPQSDFEQQLFSNSTTNYFEFRYKVSLEKGIQRKK